MSLETKIEALTAAVIALTERMDTLRQPQAQRNNDAPEVGQAVPAEKPKGEKPKVERQEAEKPKAEKQESDNTPTAQDLMEMCLSIVKTDRNLKDKIKDIIAGYGGKTIAEVDVGKYNDLKADLESLQ